MQNDSSNDLEKFTLLFNQVNRSEYHNRRWRESKDKPPAFVKVDVEAAALPGALRLAWKQLAGQDLSDIARIDCVGVVLRTDHADPKRNAENMCYNAHMGLFPAKTRLRSLNIAYTQYIKPRKNEDVDRWLISNYGHTLFHLVRTGNPEAIDKLYGTDLALRNIDYLTQYHIPGYVQALKNIRQEMAVFEGQIKMAEDIYKTIYASDMPDPVDIFLKEYLRGIAIEMSDFRVNATLEALLEEDCMDEMRVALYESYSLGGVEISEHIPVVSWDINECFFLYDFAGRCYLEEQQSEVEQCVNDALAGNASGLIELIAQHKKDLRPFAEYAEKLVDAKFLKEAAAIVSNLSFRGIYADHFMSKVSLEKITEWNLSQKRTMPEEKESTLAKLRESKRLLSAEPKPKNKKNKKDGPEL